MLEPELVRGSERRARPDRGLAVGLQRGAATQLAGVSDAGRVRPPSSRAPVAYGSLRAAARPGPSFVGARRPPGSYIMTGLKTGGRSHGCHVVLDSRLADPDNSAFKTNSTIYMTAITSSCIV